MFSSTVRPPFCHTPVCTQFFGHKKVINRKITTYLLLLLISIKDFESLKLRFIEEAQNQSWLRYGIFSGSRKSGNPGDWHRDLKISENPEKYPKEVNLMFDVFDG